MIGRPKRNTRTTTLALEKEVAIDMNDISDEEMSVDEYNEASVYPASCVEDDLDDGEGLGIQRRRRRTANATEKE
jgi:hypothetical protein